MQEVKVADTAIWVTLTYENPPLDDNGLMTLRKSDVQKFFKRLRKVSRDYSSQRIKYYLCGEYGSQTERPHYHAVIFNSDRLAIFKCWSEFSDMYDEQGVKLGFSTFDVVNERTVAYTAKYMNKGKLIPKWKGDLRLPEFQLFSKGLGINFISDATRSFYNSDPTRNFVYVDGFRKALPKYFADKLIICPVYRLARSLFAQAQADRELERQRAEWQASPTYHQTFESFRASKKKHALQQFRDRLKNRNKM